MFLAPWDRSVMLLGWIEQNFKQHAENIYAQILSVVSNNPDTEE